MQRENYKRRDIESEYYLDVLTVAHCVVDVHGRIPKTVRMYGLQFKPAVNGKMKMLAIRPNYDLYPDPFRGGHDLAVLRVAVDKLYVFVSVQSEETAHVLCERMFLIDRNNKDSQWYTDIVPEKQTKLRELEDDVFTILDPIFTHLVGIRLRWWVYSVLYVVCVTK